MEDDIKPSRYFIIDGTKAKIVISPSMASTYHESPQLLRETVEEYLNMMRIEFGQQVEDTDEDINFYYEQDMVALVNSMDDGDVDSNLHFMNTFHNGTYLTLDDLIEEILPKIEIDQLKEKVASIIGGKAD